jgi:hypothetical protein
MTRTPLTVIARDADAVDIGDLYRKARRSLAVSVRYAIQCGRRLRAKKDSLDHGQWLPWLRDNAEVLGFEHRTTATRLMKLANGAPAHHLDEATALAISRQLWGHTEDEDDDRNADNADLDKLLRDDDGELTAQARKFIRDAHPEPEEVRAAILDRVEAGDELTYAEINEEIGRCKATAKSARAEGIIYTVTIGDNADLIANVARLYLRDGDTVADVTYGNGRFWDKMDGRRFKLLASDIAPRVPQSVRANLRSLPYENASVDIVVLDPPYMHHSGQHITHKSYDPTMATKDLTHPEIVQLFRDGMTEAKRVLKTGRLLWVKVKDDIESGKQRRSSIEIYDIAMSLGLIDQDRFILVGGMANPKRWQQQLHARKNHSELWVFRKPSS